jgi:hypothetical protein
MEDQGTQLSSVRGGLNRSETELYIDMTTLRAE